MKTVSVYLASGRIISSQTIPDSDLQFVLQNGGVGYVDGAYSWDTHYVDPVAKAAVLRPNSPCMVVGRTIVNVPTNAIIEHEGTEYPCSDGVAEIEMAFLAPIQVTVKAWPYLDKTFTVNP